VTAFFIYQGMDKAAFGVFAFAGLSDAVDGYLAKRLALGTRFGAYLDPAADKLLMLACFVTLTVVGMTPLWLTAIVIGRDVAILLGLALARVMALPLEVAPLFIGKASTAVQVAYVALVLAVLAFGIVAPRLLNAGAIAVATFTIASWLGYGQLLVRAIAVRRKTA
jgi:cardiolipin synthase